MGVRMSQPMPGPGNPGCVSIAHVFSAFKKCYEDPRPPKPLPPNPPKIPDWGTTKLRITVGAHEDGDMGGSIPGVAVFNELGERLGETYSVALTTVEGSFKDVMVRHKKDMANVRPSYLLLHAGYNSICIASVAIEYPDGGKQVISGTDLSLCEDRLITHDSRTFVGPTQAQPKCFWLHGTKAGGYGFQRVSFHLPDFVWSKERREAYARNRALVCKITPRFFTSYGNGEKITLDAPIPIFNPPIEYDPETHFDVDPQHVLTWQMPSFNTPQHFSDRRFIRAKPWSKRTTTKPPVLPYNTTAIDIAALLTSGVIHNNEEEMPESLSEEEEHIRTEPPKLVISKSEISAQEQCRHGTWNNTDYVSLSEGIFCDMQSRTMADVCGPYSQFLCWNATSQRLQGENKKPLPYQTVPPELPDELYATLRFDAANKTWLNPKWPTTGPLFGFTYPSVALIG